MRGQAVFHRLLPCGPHRRGSDASGAMEAGGHGKTAPIRDKRR